MTGVRPILFALVALAGCGDDGEDRQTATAPIPTPSAAPETSPSSEPTGTSAPFVGSLTVDPQRGTLIIGTGMGLFRLEKGAKTATPFDAELTTPDGSGTVPASDISGARHRTGPNGPRRIGIAGATASPERRMGHGWCLAPDVAAGAMAARGHRSSPDRPSRLLELALELGQPLGPLVDDRGDERRLRPCLERVRQVRSIAGPS